MAPGIVEKLMKQKREVMITITSINVATEMGAVILSLTNTDLSKDMNTVRAGKRDIIIAGIIAKSAKSGVRADTFINQRSARGVAVNRKTAEVEPKAIINAKLRIFL